MNMIEVIGEFYELLPIEKWTDFHCCLLDAVLFLFFYSSFFENSIFDPICKVSANSKKSDLVKFLKELKILISSGLGKYETVNS